MANVPIDINELPPRPGGGKWRAVELQVAWLRVQDVPWAEVAESTPYEQGTVQKYTQRDWWDTLYDYCAQRWLEERARQKRQEDLEAQRKFRQDEEELTQRGIILALETLIEVMEGKPLRDPESGDVIVNMFGMPRVPSAQTKTLAARTFAQIVGYKKAKEHLAKMMIEQAEKAKEQERKVQGRAIDLSIMGVDEDAAE